MLASELVKLYGDDLIGKRVWTYRFGEWPGGPATVVNIYPDRDAPDTGFGVEGQGYEYMDILEHEEVAILERELRSQTEDTK